MNVKQFIKVTPKGGGKSHIIPEGNRAYYLSQGAKIETPTREEVLKAFPEIKREKQAESDAQDAAKLKAEIKALKRDNASLKDDLIREEETSAKLIEENKALKADNDRLSKEINRLTAMGQEAELAVLSDPAEEPAPTDQTAGEKPTEGKKTAKKANK